MTLRAALAPVLIVALLLVTVGAHADDREEAEKRFRAGVALQKVEDWNAAVVEFEASLRLYPTKGALFNLANALRATHRYVQALDALERLERDYAEKLDEPMRSATESLIVELEDLTSVLEIAVDQPGAQIRVDGEPIGTSPLNGPLRLDVGRHRIDVTLEGYEPALVKVNLASRENRAETISLRSSQPEPRPQPQPQPGAQPPPSSPPDATRERRGPSLRTTAWVTTGAGLVLLGSGTITGTLALGIDGKLQDECIGGHCPPDREGDIRRLEILAPTTNALLTVGAVATATGITLVLVDRHRSMRSVGPSLRLSTGPSFVGTSLRGSF